MCQLEANKSRCGYSLQLIETHRNNELPESELLSQSWQQDFRSRYHQMLQKKQAHAKQNDAHFRSRMTSLSSLKQDPPLLLSRRKPLLFCTYPRSAKEKNMRHDEKECILSSAPKQTGFMSPIQIADLSNFSPLCPGWGREQTSQGYLSRVARQREVQQVPPACDSKSSRDPPLSKYQRCLNQTHPVTHRLTLRMLCCTPPRKALEIWIETWWSWV
mmetsp:Transcript_20606/g.30343  ORF Transcript_20606/g.30343 Transcript_20606/m.30343 type:complete len:216 (-) Transcript_20606:284-931(-)